MAKFTSRSFSPSGPRELCERREKRRDEIERDATDTKRRAILRRRTHAGAKRPLDALASPRRLACVPAPPPKGTTCRLEACGRLHTF